jgi:hypothetical protein
MMQQLVSYMMGKGDVTLAGTIHETVVAGIREEVRQEFRAMLDEKDARIAALEALVNQDHDGESPLITIKKLEHQNEDLRRTTYGQKTEGKYNGRNNMTPADEADLNGEEVPESTFDVSDEEFSEVMDGINVIRKKMQMRQIAIYRNQSYFLGSVKSAKRFARLVSLTQSAKNCKRNVQKYFHDILNRAVVTVKEELISILPHKWVEPVTIPLVY